MADYHIYLHGSGSDENNVSPAKPKSYGSNREYMSAAKPWQQAAQFISNPDSLLGVAKQKAMTELNNVAKDSDIAAKAVVFIAIAKAVAQIIDSAATTGTQLADLYTGGDSTRVWNNIKQPVQWIMNPISTTFNAWTTITRVKRDNVRKQLNTQLLGDSQINTNYNRRV